MSQAQREQQKYERIWKVPEYRKESPGMRVLSHALDLLKPAPGASFYDFGCGHGYVVAALEGMRYPTTGVDIARNAKGVYAGGFVLANLWALPFEMRPADHGICVDVLEHLPTEQVLPALRCMASKVNRSIFFQAALFPDSFGNAIGEELHLTVKPAEWWVDQFREVFCGHFEWSSDGRHFEAIARVV